MNLRTVVVFACLAVLPACQGGSGGDTPSGGEGSAGGGTAPFVQDYLQVADAAGQETTAVDAEFVADALRKLAAALGTLNLGDVELQGALRVAAEHVVSSPQPEGTTAAVRSSLIRAAQAIAEGGKGDGGLQKTAESLREDQPLADQTPIVREFLRQSGAALRQVAGS